MAPTFASVAPGYVSAWSSCALRPERAATVDGIVSRVADTATRARYEAAGADGGGAPWFVVAAIHNLEASGRWNGTIADGGALPPGVTWEADAARELRSQGHGWADWSVAGCSYFCERWNGWGYRGHGIPSPYLYSFGTCYTAGKYVSDGVYDPAAVSAQCGAVMLIRRLAERGMIETPSLAIVPAGGGGAGPASEPPSGGGGALGVLAAAAVAWGVAPDLGLLA